MSDVELLVALASTPLGLMVGFPFVCLGVSGLHYVWVNRSPTIKSRRGKLALQARQLRSRV